MIVIVALAGGLGALLRLLVDRAVSRLASGLGTFMVNVTGSFLLGWLVGSGLDDQLTHVLGTGLLGGYTTFSAASVDAVSAAREGGSVLRAVGHVMAMVVTCVLAAAAGVAVA